MDLVKSLTRLGYKPEEYTIWDGKITMIPQMETKIVSPAEYDDEGKLLFEAETEEVDVAKKKPSEQELASAWEEVQLQESDIAALISAYIADKQRDPENDTFNISEGLLYSFDFAHISKPSNAQLLALKSSVEQKASQEQINAEAEQYLKDTDFHVFKMMELGTPMPAGMSVLRQQARDRIVRS